MLEKVTQLLQEVEGFTPKSEKELEEFIDSLPSAVFENLGEFFNSMPKVQHPIKVTNPKTKKKGEVIIEGIQSFFE